MKNLLVLAFCFFIFISFSQTSQVRNITVNGQVRSFRLYVPSIYSATNKVPLVFNFHGYTSNAQEQEVYGDFRGIADTANFILVHPDGLDIGGGAGWNNFGTIAPSNYDYLFVEAMISALSTEFSIDSNRIYSTGMSNGGFMSYDLACFMSNRIAAIASVSGSIVPAHLNACNPGRNVPVMQIHGTTDPTVSYSGTGGILSSTNIDSLVKFWNVYNSCSPTSVQSNLPNINTSDNCTATHFVWSGSSENSAVELYKIINGVHAWPGTVFTSLGTNQDFNASKQIWRFFSKYKLSQSLNEIDAKTENTLKIYPNPLENNLNIEFSGSFSGKLELFDFTGKLVFEKEIQSSNKTQLDLSDFESGIYILKFGNEKSKVVIGH